MPTVFIPAQLRGLTSGQAQVEVAATTVAEAIAQLDEQFPGIRARLCQGENLIPGLQVSVDDRFTRQGLSARLQAASEVHFLPVIGGG
ncbi:ThiS family protein [Anatilimnocola aggregata]|uniref:ThiS family protein n=1 Tax=Anatilimnocola aggregata TaxID=2528021 RepID=A0A517Y500_9BACT|nr:MoaD/ThiS family protein [Anatilimnocola aggregata]QDU25270.1 ThiS family protein [Anatilimnocola aggregata]